MYVHGVREKELQQGTHGVCVFQFRSMRGVLVRAHNVVCFIATKLSATRSRTRICHFDLFVFEFVEFEERANTARTMLALFRVRNNQLGCISLYTVVFRGNLTLDL